MISLTLGGFRAMLLGTVALGPMWNCAKALKWFDWARGAEKTPFRTLHYVRA